MPTLAFGMDQVRHRWRFVKFAAPCRRDAT
jgi:hypothetical protein